MFAVRIPLPSAQPLSPEVERATVDFPERHVSYVIAGCRTAHLERCILEVLKIVDSRPIGAEPPIVEIRVPISH